MTTEEKQNLFMASISHELRTPLTSILGYGELLEETNLDSRQQEYLDRMLHSSKYLLSLVGDFLDIVKLEKNDIKLEQKEVRLHTLLSECADVIKTNLNPNVFFDINIPFLRYTIQADERRIKQVMLNILSNSAKFTQEGTIKFHVTDIQDRKESIKVTIQIEDTGIGMSPEIQKVLFNPFVTSDSTQGFGLGLYISTEIIKLMDGDISVVSKEGVGSCFTISFIVQKAQDKISKKVLSGKRILLLSKDDPSHLNELKTDIEMFHATLDYLDPAEKTFNTLFDHLQTYDIVIFDMRTPLRSVAELISTLKLSHPHIKFVGLVNANTNLTTSSFDRLIQYSKDPETIAFELEEFAANEHTINTGFMDFSYLKVLVVEDVEMSYEYIQKMLAVSFSIDCDLATNGEEAVEKARHNTYDIILMDIRMPIMNGYEATKAIRKFNKEIPIVCMSADVYAKDVEAAKEAGMNKFISKPIDKNEIKQVLLDLGVTQVRDNPSRVPIALKKSTEHFQEIMYTSDELKERAYTHLEGLFDDRSIVTSLLQKAVESMEKYINSVKLNKIEKNTEALAEDMHAMKGVLANLGLKEASTVAGEIQQYFQSGNLKQAFKVKNEFIQTISHFVEELKKELQ
jgi:CheY-like chemotaxis protein/HPt (histidine-containing phosphotransfer) domain-containing protein/anti-sigma regulatory factor (Ser/Thr protein kinase)